MKSDDGRDDVLEKNVEHLLGGAYAPPQIADGARRRIRAKLVAEAGERVPARRGRWAGVLVVGLAAAGVAGFFVLRALRHHAAAEVTQRDGQEVRFADGSTAILDRGAKVDVIARRHVRLTGRALFDVVPGQGKFVVDTAGGRIEVLGTRFAVDTAADQTRAVVIRGAVRLTSPQGETLLYAGEMGTAERGRPPTRGPAPRLSHLLSWAAGERRRSEPVAPLPIRNGTLLARTTGVPMHAPFFDASEYPLPLSELTLDAVVDNQVARVALDQTFHNPQAQDLEAVYRFALPADASLSRLAMYVNGTLQESAVVERMQARRVYEDLVYHRVDPALLEWTGAGKVELRVYPVPAQQDKRIVLGYTQSLPRLYDTYQLAVPLPALDGPVGHVHMTVRVKGCAKCELASPSHEVRTTVDGDDALVSYDRHGERLGDALILVVREPGHGAQVAEKLDGGFRYLMVRSQPALDAGPVAEHRPRRWVIVDDVSASRTAVQRKAQAEIVDRLLTELDEDDEVAVLAFDVSVRGQGPLTRVRKVDRKQVRAFLDGEHGGVGATDLGAAFTAGLGLLSGQDARDAYVVYLGDGEVTDGERTLGPLREQLRGHATFVGVAVGDGADLPTLGALADATGGMTYSIDPADDLGWRAFDLVAALYTPRATGLAVDVVGADGTPVAGALAYLGAGQLGDGEQLEVVARLPASATASAVVVRGQLGGQAWSTRIELAAASRPAGDPGYLPRLWGQKRIAALLRGKLDVPGVACAGEPCPSPDELREAHREVLRKEIVALGKAYFLLSRHTSLLVLEDDAMYARYGVPRTRTAEWAPYVLPATIPVPKPTPGPPLGGEAEAVLVRIPQPIFYSPVVTRATRGFEDRVGDRARIGGGELATGEWMGRDHLENNTESLRREAPPTEPLAASDATAPGAEKVAAQRETVSQQVVTTAEIQGSIGGLGTKGLGIGGFGQGAGGHHGWFGGGKGKGEELGGVVAPIALTSPYDERLDDVTDRVPGFFPGAFDDGVVELGHAAGGKHGSVSEAARALLASARRQLAPGVYRWGDGPAIAVDAQGRLGWRVSDENGLEEWNSYDGTTWRRAYPELGLELTRVMGDDEPALLGALLPVLLAAPEHLARWYHVTADGHTLKLAPAAGGAADAITAELDGGGRLVTLRVGADVITITWGAAGPTAARLGARSIAVSYAAEAITDAAARGRSDASGLVGVELPLHTPVYWRNRLAALAPGRDPWRQAQRQLLAALAALGDRNGLWTEYRALRDHGGVSLGDLALASRGVAGASSDAELAAVVSQATGGARALADYLAAARAVRKQPKAGKLAAQPGAGLLGTLLAYREVLAQTNADQLDGALAALDALGDRAPLLRFVATWNLSSRWSYRSTKVVRAWDAAARGPWRNLARYEAARALLARDREGAADRFAALLADVDLSAAPFRYDGTIYYALQQSRRGPAGWQLAYAAWKARVLAQGDLDQVLALVPAAAQAAPGDLDRVLGRAGELAVGSGDAVASVAELARSYGQMDRAAALIEAARKTSPSPALDRMAAAIAEQQGRPAEAAHLLGAALAAEGDEARPLSQLRADYAHLIQLGGRVSALATGAERARAVAGLLDVAERWRQVDPDDDARDQQVAGALLAAGQDAEAMRVLSTVIERHPMEGTGWAATAETLEQQGRIEAARDKWHQAVVIDQTNPTWRLRDAQLLFALGRNDEATRELTDITGRKWHDRWQGVVYQARQLLEQGKRPR